MSGMEPRTCSIAHALSNPSISARARYARSAAGSNAPSSTNCGMETAKRTSAPTSAGCTGSVQLSEHAAPYCRVIELARVLTSDGSEHHAARRLVAGEPCLQGGDDGIWVGGVTGPQLD